MMRAGGNPRQPAGIGSWEWDLSEPGARWSDSMCAIFGVAPGSRPTAEEFLAMIHPDDRESTRQAIARARPSDETAMTYRIVRPDGAVRELESRRQAFAGPDGGLARMSGTVVDVTELRANETALADSRATLRALFEHVPLAISLRGLDGRYVHVNGRAAQIFGRAAEEFIGRRPEELLTPEQVRSATKDDSRILAGGEPLVEEVQVAIGGQPRDFTLLKFPVRGPDGTVTALGLVTLDITERKASEDAARAEHDRAEAIIAAMGEGYGLIVDDELRDVNDALCRLTGFSREELVGSRMPFPFSVPGEASALFRVRNDLVAHRGGTFELTVARKTGERFEAEVTAQPALDEHGGLLGLVTTVRDISARKRRQAELEWLARTDALTGLANRRVLVEALTREIQLARRHRRPLSLIVLDLDRFKSVNDRHGHPVGDAVLVELSRRLSATVRSGETLARVGGEEFAWLLPEAPAAGAISVAERARRLVQDTPFADAGRLTISVGVSTAVDGVGFDAIYQSADAALYEAKQSGRNQTVYREALPDDAASGLPQR